MRCLTANSKNWSETVALSDSDAVEDLKSYAECISLADGKVSFRLVTLPNPYCSLALGYDWKRIGTINLRDNERIQQN